MAVSSTSSRVVYDGDGSTSSFDFAFYLSDQADLIVACTDADGTRTVIAPGPAPAGYQISPPAQPAPGWPGGGTVTYNPGSPLAPGRTLTLQRSVAATQPTTLSNQGALWPQVIERALDRIVTVVQGFIDGMNRSLQAPPDDNLALNPLPGKALRADTLLGFDGDGQPQAVTLTSSLVAVGTWVRSTLLPQSTRPAALAALGAAGTADDNGFSGANSFAGSTVFSGPTTLTRALAGSTLRSFLGGLGLANSAGTPNSRIDVAAGACADDTNVAMLALAGGTIDCAATGANGLDAGALAASTWYHAFVVGTADGTAALLASTSASAPVLPVGYTLKRRIGSFRTDGSGHILPFAQNGDRFDWGAASSTGALSPASTTAQTPALGGVPAGVASDAILSGELVDGAAGAAIACLSSLAQADVPAGAGNLAARSYSTTVGGPFAGVRVMTDASQRIRYRLSTATASITINVHGWIDRRGREA